MSTQRRYDLVIVGAGLVGGLIAAEATRRGRSVALIEAGRRYSLADRPEQLLRHQVLGGLKWPYLHEDRDRYTDSSEPSIGVSYKLESHRLKGVGGSTLHWGGRISRLKPSDFATQTAYGTGKDWPISYEDIERYYSRAEWELGVSGSEHPALPLRSKGYPNPGFPLSVDDQMWLPVADRLGIALYSSPFAINSKAYAGRPECQAIAACELCPSGARYSADVHVQLAERTGLCDLMSETVARRIDINASGEVRAIHVSSLEGEEREIQGTNYVVAAHAVESARLLLLSECGNHSDQVGRNFMEHIYVEGGGHFPGRRFYPQRGGYEVLESLSYYDGDGRRERGGIKIEFTFEQDPLADMEGRRIWGQAMARHDRENFGHWAGIAAETEHLPNPDSRVSLDPEIQDLFGDPVPHLHLAFSALDRQTQRRAREIIQELLGEAGAVDVVQDPMTSNSFGAHHLGTCRMSADPNQGVVDSDCRVHGTSNLFVAGGSVFPSGGAVQPSLTIAALALRLADHLYPA
jgi:choline dehydrogenase-like flavoprotein